jgi:RNA recognition motif-containing protein
MSDEAAEASAIEALQGAELMGRPLRINKAEPRGSAPRRDFGGGNYGGGGGGNYGGGGGGNYGGGGGGNYGGGERRSGASGWEDRSYGSGAPPAGGSAYDDGRTRRRRGGADDNSGYGGAEG